MTAVRIQANMEDDYIQRVKLTWGKAMMMAKEQGLIEDYKTFLGPRANESDYNMLLMIEFSGMGAFDPDEERDAKWDAIEQEVRKQMDGAYDNALMTYTEIRDIVGEEVMREITFKGFVQNFV